MIFLIKKAFNTPKVQNDYYSPIRVRGKFNEKDFRFNTYISEKFRVQESLKNAEILDTVPMPPLKTLERVREPDKEIGPVFRFKAKNNSERLADYISKSGLSALQSPSAINEIKYFL